VNLMGRILIIGVLIIAFAGCTLVPAKPDPPQNWVETRRINLKGAIVSEIATGWYWIEDDTCAVISWVGAGNGGGSVQVLPDVKRKDDCK
jgi:hypothetical protein